MTEPLVVPPNMNGPHLTAFFTRKGPGGEPAAVARLLHVPVNTIYLPIQKHTDKVTVLDFDRDPKIADAVVTHRSDVVIGIQVADCVPILLYDPRKRVVGAVHAGWRGTAGGILKKTVETMAERFFSSPADILVAVGPSIKWCCYEVGPEVIEAVAAVTEGEDYFMKKGEKYCLDLATANRLQAGAAGVPEQNVWVSEECTFCLPDLYFSYRYAKGSTGRQGGFIGLKRV